MSIFRKTSVVCFLVVPLLTMFSCARMKPGGATKGRGGRFDTFFIGDGGVQYFVDQIVFQSEDTKSKLLMDFTFRHSSSKSSSVTFNLSVYTSCYTKSIDSLLLYTGNNRSVIDSIGNLFAEREKKNFHSRFTCVMSLDELTAFLEDSNPKITIYSNCGSTQYAPSAKTSKAIRKLNDELFVLFK